MEPVIRTENLSHVYSAGTPFQLTALNEVNFEAHEGEFLAIIGHTGSGKSTLIQHLNALIKPTSGAVYLDGQDINATKESVRAARFQVGLVFQYPEYQLFEETVYKDIAFGPGNMKLSTAEIDERVREAADFSGLSEELLEKSPFELSGGQKRRAAIAGVIAMRPRVLILDEPMAGLDPGGCREIMANIRRYHREKNATVIMVTHDMSQAARTADRLVVMHKGAIAMTGTPAQVFSRSEALTGMGLDLPDVTKIALRLRERGLDVDPSSYTIQQLRDEILRLKGGEARA